MSEMSGAVAGRREDRSVARWARRLRRTRRVAKAALVGAKTWGKEEPGGRGVRSTTPTHATAAVTATRRMCNLLVSRTVAVYAAASHRDLVHAPAVAGGDGGEGVDRERGRGDEGREGAQPAGVEGLRTAEQTQVRQQ